MPRWEAEHQQVAVPWSLQVGALHLVDASCQLAAPLNPVEASCLAVVSCLVVASRLAVALRLAVASCLVALLSLVVALLSLVVA